MTTSTSASLLSLILGAALLAGCGGDPLSGEWEHKDAEEVDLDIEATDDGWEGEGHLVVCYEDGDCFLCPIEFRVTETGDQRYEVEGEFVEECSDLGSFDDIECELEGQDELECELPDGGGTLEYERTSPAE